MNESSEIKKQDSMQPVSVFNSAENPAENHFSYVKSRCSSVHTGLWPLRLDGINW